MFGKLIPPWVIGLVGIAILMGAFGTGWKVNGWRNAERIASLEAESQRAWLAERTAKAFADSCRDDVAEINSSLAAMTAARNEANARYLEALNRPPRTVIEYRDRPPADTTIISRDCPEAVGQTIRWLQTLPALRPGGE